MNWTKVSKELPEYDKLVLVVWKTIFGELKQSVSSVSSVTVHVGKDSPMIDRWWIYASRHEIKPIYWTELPEMPKH